MNRKEFLKGSAIIGAAIVAPSLILRGSGLYAQANKRSVHQILTAGKTKVGTLPILRAFAGDHLDYVSPFVLFDEFGPVSIAAGSDPLRVDAHPHAGVTPTTFFLSGGGHHKDSLNYDFQIEQGQFMMFHSGRGAIHMEESSEKLKKEGGELHGFQIWLNTPAKYKKEAPSTLVHNKPDLPTIIGPDYSIDVVMGSLMNSTSKVETYSPAFYYHIKLNKGAKLSIPVDPSHNAFAYNVKGKLELEAQKLLLPNQIALFERAGDEIDLLAQEDSELFLLGGKPLNEPVYSYGPFVMNSEPEIRQCYRDYRQGKMGDPKKVNAK